MLFAVAILRALARDKTAIIAACGGAIIDSAAFSDPDGAIGPVIQFCRRYGERLRLIRYDSCGIGFHFAGPLIAAGFRCEPINVAKACDKDEDKQRFSNQKAFRYWNFRERLRRGEVSGLTVAMVAELSVMTYLIGNSGRIAIAGKDDVRSVLGGASPDLSESAMLALGTPQPIPLEGAYRGIARGQVSPQESGHLAALGYPESREEAERNYNDDQMGEQRMRHGPGAGRIFQADGGGCAGIN
jgi:hypothetical protein